jgi:hypothetical protein
MRAGNFREHNRKQVEHGEGSETAAVVRPGNVFELLRSLLSVRSGRENKSNMLLVVPPPRLFHRR